MQYLVVLLLIVGIAVLTLAALLGLSYGLGALLNARTRPAKPAADPALRFEADREWYEALPPWQRNAVFVWWLVNRYFYNLHERRGLASRGSTPG